MKEDGILMTDAQHITIMDIGMFYMNVNIHRCQSCLTNVNTFFLNI